MNCLDKNIHPFIVLFWSLPSLSKLHEYKEKCNMLNLAISKMKTVEIITVKDVILNLTNISLESGRYFGLENIKGRFKKILLNINEIKTITFL